MSAGLTVLRKYGTHRFPQGAQVGLGHRIHLPHIHFHDLRHSTATFLLSLAIHPKVVQEILGHSQISMTLDIYSHVLPTMQKEAMERLSKALQEQKGEASEQAGDTTPQVQKDDASQDQEHDA